jgi:hypothetical protein
MEYEFLFLFKPKVPKNSRKLMIRIFIPIKSYPILLAGYETLTLKAKHLYELAVQN